MARISDEVEDICTQTMVPHAPILMSFWRQVHELLEADAVNHSARLAAVASWSLSVRGGLMWLIEARLDYWRLIDYEADRQYEEYLAMITSSDSESDHSW